MAEIGPDKPYQRKAQPHWLTIRVRDNIAQPDYEQHVEVLDGDRVIGELWGVRRAEGVMVPNGYGTLTLTLESRLESSPVFVPPPNDA